MFTATQTNDNGETRQRHSFFAHNEKKFADQAGGFIF